MQRIFAAGTVRNIYLLIGLTGALAAPYAVDDELPAAPRLPPAPQFDARSAARVLRIIDERTIVVEAADDTHQQPQIVRLAGLARPRGDAAKTAAKSFLTSLLLGEDVQLVPAGPRADSGEAQLALVHRTPDQLLVNLEVIRQGYAPLAAQGEIPHAELLNTYQARAKRMQKGIWAETPASMPAPAQISGDIPPEPAGADTHEVFVTPSGTKYHRADCTFARNARAILLRDARAKYGPCSRCKPPQ